MVNRKNAPVEVTGYRNVWLPTFNANDEMISERWWSVKQELYADEDFLPWNDESGSDIPPF
jgi:hypothetical protein